jgi:2'-5' RNA ligase/GNAT superfamily N-acetyltransferase
MTECGSWQGLRVPKRRLGVVLLVPPPWSVEIEGLRRALGDGGLGRIPTHLTLVPPVNVREDRIPEAMAVVRDAAQRTGPMTVRLGPPATFLPINPVAYLPVAGEGLAAVQRLRELVFRPPLERSLTWSFVPHVTVADEAEPERIDAAITALAEYEIDVTFDRVHLLEEGAGRTWRPIADVPFGAPAIIGRGGREVALHRSLHLDVEAEEWTTREWSEYALADYGEAEEDEPFAIVARRAGEVVGTATGAVRGDEAYLARLIVSSNERGSGVGSHLLAAVEALAAERGCRRLTLRTQASGTARAFYEARGWRAYATLDRWRAGRDFVQMERVLAPPSP